MYIWVDAICIDQRNNDEKSRQVRVMDDIYSKAEVVSVWLDFVQNESTTERLDWHTQTITTLDIEGWHWSDDIEELVKRPYWRRFWVVQEFLLAKQLHIWYRGNVIDIYSLSDAIGTEAEVDMLSSDDRQMQKILQKSNKYPALSLIAGRHIDRYPEFQEPLYDLLLRHKDAQCKDPRDRVFSLLGLLPLDDRAYMGQNLPNYDMSHDEVVVMTLAHMMHMARGRKQFPDDIFHALGVGPGKKRKDLLKLTEEFASYDPDLDSRPAAWPFWGGDAQEGELSGAPSTDNNAEMEALLQNQFEAMRRAYGMPTSGAQRSQHSKWIRWLPGLCIVTVLPAAIYVWTVLRKR